MVRAKLCILLIGFIGLFGIAEASPIPAEKLFATPSVTLPDLSPNGRYVSYILEHEEQNYLALQDTSDYSIQAPLLIEDDQILREYNWLDENTLLVNVTMGKKDKLVVVYREPSSDEPKWNNLVLKRDGYLVGLLKEDNERVLLALNSSREGTNYDLYHLPINELVSGKIDERFLVRESKPGQRIYAYEEEFNRLLVMTIDVKNKVINMALRNLGSTAPLQEFTLDAITFDFVPMGFLSETKIAVLSNQDVNTMSLFEYDLSTNQLGKRLFKHEKYDLVDAEVSARTGELVSVNYYDHGRLVTEYFDQANRDNSEFLKKSLVDKQYTVAAENLDTGQKVLFVFSSDDPGQYYLFNENKKKVLPILKRHPQLEGVKLSANKRIQVRSADGTEIEAYLTLPTGKDLKTLLVMPHGGPIGVREYDEFNPEVQYYASRGFSILRVNFRGSAGFGKDFEQAGVGEFGKLIETDIAAAVAQVEKTIQFEHKCAMGASYGGYSSMMLAIKHPQDYACVVGSFGVYDLPLLFNSSNYNLFEEVRESLEQVVGEESEALFEVSPVYLAGKVHAPVLLIAGLEDKIAPAEHSRRMEYVLKHYGRQVQSVYYKNSGHGHNSWFGDWHQATLTYQFLLETLKLPTLTQDQIRAEDLVYIQDEYKRVADFYDNGWQIDKDLDQAIKFYRLAEDLGSDKVKVNLAWYHKSGKIVDKDVEKAKALFRAAAEAGQANGAYNLAELLGDSKEALDYYQQALDNDYNLAASLRVAAFYCLGDVVELDVSKCIEMLDLETMSKDKEQKKRINNSSYGIRRAVLAKLLVDPKLLESTRTLLRDAIKDWYGIDTWGVEVEVDEFGLSKQVSRGYEFDGNPNIQLIEDGRYGVQFDVDVDTFKLSHKSMFVIEWHANLPDGTHSIVIQDIVWGNMRNNWYGFIQTNSIPENSTSISLLVSDTNGRRLLTQQFAVTPAP